MMLSELRFLGTTTVRRLIKFGMVGLSNVVIYTTLLYLLTEVFGFWYVASSLVGSVVVFFWSFGLNSIWTWRSR